MRALIGREAMRECEHGCGVKMFCFSVVLSKQASKPDEFEKSFWVENTTSLLLIFTHFPIGWDLENLYKPAVAIFFHLSWHFKNEWFKRKTIITKITTIITYARLRVQDFATCKNFAFNQCHNKEFCNLSLGSSSQIHCIALHVLQTSKEIWVFLFCQSS